MLRPKKRMFKEVPREARHSLEVLDNILNEYCENTNVSFPATLRKIKDVPSDVRRSLEILDDILTKYDVEDVDFPNRKCESCEDLRTSEEVPQEVSKSLEMLDRVLDEFEYENTSRSAGKRNIENKSESFGRSRHEDIRRSLEVLDSVLAEFDDCLESWDSLPPFHNGGDSYDFFSEPNRNLYAKDFPDSEVNGHSLPADYSHEISSIDGSTSHDFSGSSAPEQPKISSPPPVPKRSPATRLSERNSALFSFPSSDNTSLDSYDSTRSDSFSQDNNEAALSRTARHYLQISALSAGDAIDIGQDDDVFTVSKSPFDSSSCANCGRSLMARPQTDSSQEDKDISTSPFAQRRQMFEEKTAAPRSSPGLKRTPTGSSFRTKRGLDTSLNHPAIFFNKSFQEGGTTDGSSPPTSKLIKVVPPSVDKAVLSSVTTYHAKNCTCKEKIRQLHIKFAETSRLLKAKKIKGLDKAPPSFIMPIPPEKSEKPRQNEKKSGAVKQSSEPPDVTNLAESSLLSSDSFETAKEYNDSDKDVNLSIGSEFFNTPSSKFVAKSHEENVSQQNQPSPDLSNPEDPRLCNTCSRSLSIPLSETIEDLPKLLPTDALNRPQLGLSYSMEDDLSPGVKEIQRTSTPKSDIQNNNKDMCSLSISSLGYVSSQSDLDLNNSLLDYTSGSSVHYPPLPADKVPVSIRSKTLPEGMKLSPFYSDADQVHELYSKYDRVHRDRNFNHTSSEDLQLRSSSAPPLPAEEKPKKKHFRGFSRKDKKKNDDSLSLKSDLSLDEGVILKKIETLDGATDKYDAVDKTDVGVEKKRWSVFRSILKKR